MEIREKLLQALMNLVDTVVASAPKVVVGLALLVGALLVAKIIERALRYVLTTVRFDQLVGKVGIDQALQRLAFGSNLRC